MLKRSHILMLTVVALLGVALVMGYSAGMTVGSPNNPIAGTTELPSSRGAAKPPAPRTQFEAQATEAPVAHAPALRLDWLALLTSRNMIYALIAVAVMMLASRIDVREFQRRRGWTHPLGWVMVFSLVLVALTFVPGISRGAKGAHRWLYLGPTSWGLSFQPSEIVKWVMVLVIAWWCATRRGRMHKFTHGLFPAMMLIGVSCGLVVIEDLGTAALIGVVAGCMLIAGGARLWQLALTIPPAAAAVVLAITHSPYRRARLTAFLDPWADPQGNGYHAIQSMLTIAQGGLFGRGLGNGIQKFGYLPEDTTDFIFAVVCEEMGLAGAGLVIGLYLVLLWVGLGIVKECKDTFGRLVGIGMLLTIGFQALINIAVVTVVVPTKGIALPLISGGGTGWIVAAFSVGLIAALDNANELEPTGETPIVPSDAELRQNAMSRLAPTPADAPRAETPAHTPPPSTPADHHDQPHAEPALAMGK